MEFVQTEMSFSAAALKKRPYSLEKEFPYPLEDFSAFHLKEKRAKSNFEGGIADDLSESYSIFDSMLEDQDYSISSELHVMKDSHTWSFDLPQNLLPSLAANDFPTCPQTTTFIDDFYSAQETLLNSCNSVQTSPTSHNNSNCYDFPVVLPSSSSTDIFCHLPELNNEFVDINFNIETQNRNPPPPYPSNDSFSKIDQRFGTCKNIPRRPNSLKLTELPTNLLGHQHFSNFSEGAFLPNASVNFQCRGRETGNQQPTLPMMQSFLELKKSPRSPMVTDSILTSTSALSFQSLSPTLPTNNFPTNTRYYNEYATDASLYRSNLLQTTRAGKKFQAMNLITIEPNASTSPDTTYSPTTPIVFSDLSSSNHTWNANLLSVNAHLSDTQCFPPKSDFQNINNPLEMQIDRVQFHPKVVQSPGCDFENKANTESFFRATCKDYTTVEAKIPNHNTLQALADKIKRNQTVKNRMNIDDIKPILDSKSLEDSQLSCRISGMNNQSNYNQSNSEETNPILYPSKRVRINSCSPLKVTIGEADTSQESSSQDKKQRRHKANKTIGADNSELVATDLPTPLRNSNYLNSFLFNLIAPISSIKKPDKDLRTTYLNKGQYYALFLDCISEKLRSARAAFRTIVMVLFQDPASVGNELDAWKTWHNKQQSFKQRILDVDFKNACSGRPQEIEEIAFNATSVVWNADNSTGIKVNVAVNCLSTDFSNQKGVKGIPLLMQLDTYIDDELIHRAHCNIKVFCDKGAERKVRDEEKKNKETKTYSEDSLNSPTSSTSPQFHSTNFHLSDDFSKVPLFFTPKPNVPIKTNSSRTFDTLFKSESQDCNTEVKNQSKPSKITLYVKDEEDVAFSEIIFHNPTVQELLEAIASKFKLKKEEIKNIYKKS